MARRRKGQFKRRARSRRFYARIRRRVKSPISLLTAIPIGVRLGVEPILGSKNYAGALGYAQKGDIQGALLEFANVVSINFTGHDFKENTWLIDRPITTYAQILLGALGSTVATKFGVNRTMKKVPMLGKYIKI